MHFTLEAHPQNLKVIPEIGEGPLLRVQGRNGIGKTLFVRLLQLATGTQPYDSMPRAWETLRAGLGQCRIRVDGLKEKRNLDLLLDPAGWPAHPEAVGEWLGTAKLNGRSAKWSDVSVLLKVFRVGGDESLVRSLSIQIRADRERLLQQRARVATVSAEWDAKLQPLLTLVDDLVTPTWDDLARVAQETRITADNARQRSQEASAELERLRRVQDLQDRLQRQQSERPSLIVRLAEVDAKTSEISAQLTTIEDSSARILASQRQTRQVRQEISNAERLYRLRAERVQKRRAELASELRFLGLAQPASEVAITQLIRENRQLLAALEASRLSADRAGLVIDLINSLEFPLERGLENELGPETIADLSHAGVTVEELQTGLDARRKILKGQTTQEAQQLSARISKTRSFLFHLDEVPRLLRLLQKAEDDLGTTAGQLEQLAGRLTGASAENYRQLQGRRVDLVDQLTALAVEKADITRQLEDLTSGGDEVELQQQLAGLGFDDSKPVPESLFQAQTQRATLAAADESAATREADSSDARLENLQRALRLAVERLRDGAFGWLSAAVDELPGRREPPAQLQSAFGRLHRAASSVHDDIVGVLNDHDALGVALENLAGRISSDGGHGALASTRLAASVTRYYERVFAQELAEPELRSALFDGGADVRIDLDTLTTTWATMDGGTRSRPLEAFSSGEHAFAYTRLQLEGVNKVSAANKVVFLDEFGAYVARDRLDDLFSFVKNKVIGAIADQVVVILPLASIPTDRESRMAIEARGYLVEVIE